VINGDADINETNWHARTTESDYSHQKIEGEQRKLPRQALFRAYQEEKKKVWKGNPALRAGNQNQKEMKDPPIYVFEMGRKDR